MKTLHLSYELAWRTDADDAFMQSPAWRQIRHNILQKDNYTCQYCAYRADKGMHVNHIDGNPKNNDPSNLEVICPQCHMIMHSGLWCVVRKVIKIYKKSKYSQNEIVAITRKLRSEGKDDQFIIGYLGLEQELPWQQDLDYLAPLFGFITSAIGPTKPLPKPHLTEEEQRNNLANRSKW